MIDFDTLVIGTGMDFFARPIIVTPLKSQPGHPAYAARGVWSSKPVNVGLEDGSVMSSNDMTLSIRESEFSVPLAQGDKIEIPAAGSLARVGIVLIDDINSDGQGAAQLVLKKVGE